MNQPQKIPSNTNQSTSKLERFVLGFEYDKTLQELRREVRVRTL